MRQPSASASADVRSAAGGAPAATPPARPPPPTSSSKFGEDCSGWLEKDGGIGFSKWKKRWFHLSASTRQLNYYDKEPAMSGNNFIVSKSTGIVDLTG